MGACCSCQIGHFEGFRPAAADEGEVKDVEEEDFVLRGDLGAHVRLRGSSKFVSMHTRKGKKGINQDAMTVWENFTGDKDMFFCGVFDGHGPSGHKVAQYVRDLLPSKLSKSSNVSGSDVGVAGDEDSIGADNEDNSELQESKDPFFTSWRGRIRKCFRAIDEELEGDATIESYCSGTTALNVFKKDEHLIVANLGDSRAVLCTRDEKDQLTAEQLTVDLKPNVPSEEQRIKSCQGRVLAMEEEPNVYRIWMPDEDCPGLAMARAFGDFCLKDFGLISTPQLFYRKLTEKDEFVVLATDGVWDVLSNNQVVAIVASARKRSLAAKTLVDYAVRAWRHKHPNAKVDDCAVVCLFFKRPRPLVLTKSLSDVTNLSSEMGKRGSAGQKKTDKDLDTVLNCNIGEAEEGGLGDRRHHRSEGNRRRAVRKYKFVET